MIHYILLPDEERHELRREYRLRLAIVTLLFLSSVVMIGMLCLLPSYVLTLNQEKDAEIQKNSIQQTRKESGADKIELELIKSQTIAERVLSTQTPVSPESIIQKISSYRTKELILTSFSVTMLTSTSTVAEVVVHGKSLTRDALLAFKKQLDSDPSFVGAVLPLADLAKNRDIVFDITMKVKKI